MATKTWKVQGKSSVHTVTLEHAYVTGKATVTVDGEVAYHRPRKWFDLGLKQKVMVEDIECLVRVIPTPWFTFSYRLLIDGKKQPVVLLRSGDNGENVVG